eukprot:SAG31_NODE_2936_length_4892_cov_5.112456_1_plen_76_part_00
MLLMLVLNSTQNLNYDLIDFLALCQSMVKDSLIQGKKRKYNNEVKYPYLFRPICQFRPPVRALRLQRQIESMSTL